MKEMSCCTLKMVLSSLLSVDGELLAHQLKFQFVAHLNILLIVFSAATEINKFKIVIMRGVVRMKESESS